MKIYLLRLGAPVLRDTCAWRDVNESGSVSKKEMGFGEWLLGKQPTVSHSRTFRFSV